MLIPRFSLRVLLVVTTICALFFFLITLAVQGQHWAIAASTAIAGLLATMLVHVAIFAVAWLLAQSWGSLRRRPITRSPFATSGPPQQIIPPVDPE